MTKKSNNSALPINKGFHQPSSTINEVAIFFLYNKKKILCLDDYVNGILSGDRIILSRAITLVESTLLKHNILSQKIIEKCIPYSGNSIRIGITGVPGVGKSTFIETFGKHLTSLGKKIAVLAIDPSSIISKGSILGDKTRMEELSNDPNAFIRPSPNAGSLGGVTRKTRESIILCEAAGFNTIIVETVGVGQSETSVNFMVDFFLLLMLAGAGDELQGIKKGIMEMADAIIINKAEKENIQNANIAKTQIQNALHLFPSPQSGWIPVVDTCSALSKTGMEKVWKIISDYLTHTKSKKFFEFKRNEQNRYHMIEMINETLKETFYKNIEVANLLPKLENKLSAQKITSYSAAQKLLNTYFKSLDEKK